MSIDVSSFNSGSVSTASIGGAAGGAVLVILIVMVCIICCIRRSKNKQKTKTYIMDKIRSYKHKKSDTTVYPNNAIYNPYNTNTIIMDTTSDFNPTAELESSFTRSSSNG